MTIRLHCAECKRKLKVPDEALGKKVQCPVCGARFIGRIEATPPAVANGLADNPLKEPLAEKPKPAPTEASTPGLPLSEAPLVDSVFAEMTSPLMDETIASASPAPGPITPLTSFPDLELEAPPIEPMMIEDEDAIEVVDEAVEEEAPIEVTDEAVFEELVSEAAIVEEDVEVVDEVDAEEVQASTGVGTRKKPARLDAEETEIVEEEDEPAQADKARQTKKKSNKLLFIGLACALGVLLLGCGGIGFVVYRHFFNGTP